MVKNKKTCLLITFDVFKLLKAGQVGRAYIAY